MESGGEWIGNFTWGMVLEKSRADFSDGNDKPVEDTQKEWSRETMHEISWNQMRDVEMG